MPKPQDNIMADDDSLEDDLKMLNEMNIDQDFNIWGDFRSSFAVKGRRESLDSLMGSRSSTRVSITDKSVAIPEDSDNRSSDLSDHHAIDHSASLDLDVSLSALTSGEKRDLRAWNIRLARDTVFSRYYFPEQWELRELKTLENFLRLENPRKDAASFSSELGHEIVSKNEAVASIFYPGDHDPKSVLLKRGPVLLEGFTERELLLFTHGFVLSRMEGDTLLNILFTINSENPEYLSSKQLEDRFYAIDSDRSGSLDRCELKEVFKSMGVPISEIALSDIMGKFDKDNDGTIDFEEFERVMHDLEPKPAAEDRWSWGSSLSSLGDKLKKTLSVGTAIEGRVDHAFLFSDIEYVESINICYSKSTQMFVQSSWGELIFSIFIKDKKEPLIMVCSKPDHRSAWVEAFCCCFVKSLHMRAQSGSEAAKKICRQFGWQHQIIRASWFSLVVCNDLEGLKEQVANPSECISIDDQDEYHGCTALHYAAALGHIGFVKLLLQHKAKVNVCDNDQKTPLDHAVLFENRDISDMMIQILEQCGAKKHSSEVLFKSALEEQKKLRSEQAPKTSTEKTVAKAKGATGAMSQAFSALKERGDRIERLDNKTGQLQSDAANYAGMAKQMKEKNKKKAGFFGVL